MAESMSRLSNPRAMKMDKPAPKAEKSMAKAEPKESGDPMHDAAEKMHRAEPGAKHMIASHDGYGLKTHSIDEQGNHEGPHEDDEAHAHMQRFMGTDEGEEAPMHHEEPMSPGGLY
jgi:hypothetical protein